MQSVDKFVYCQAMPRRAQISKRLRRPPDSRAEVLLAALIKEHLVTGEAGGSRVLSDRFRTAWLEPGDDPQRYGDRRG